MGKTMPLEILVDDLDIQKTWDLCKSAFAEHGHILRFPAGTNHRRTYQWRYATRLTQKFQDWEFDDGLATFFISTAVAYIRKRGLLRKGMTAFFQANLLDICCREAEKAYGRRNQLLNNVRESHAFIQSVTEHSNTTTQLVIRKSFADDYNLVRWYRAGRVSLMYLSVSAICAKAICRIAAMSPQQRQLLPDAKEFTAQYVEITSDSVLKSQLQNILGSDWRKLC